MTDREGEFLAGAFVGALTIVIGIAMAMIMKWWWMS